MRRLRYLGFLLVCAATPAAALATILGIVSERLDFNSAEALKGKATWGSSSADSPLDFTSDGLGCNAVGSDNAFTYAWVQTEPMALGSWGNPWYSVGFNIDVMGSCDQEGWYGVRRIFVRHSPDRRHWTAWQSMDQKTPWMLKARADHYAETWKKTWPDGPFGNGPGRPATLLDFQNRLLFTCSLVVPRTTREAYNKLLADFAATKPPHPGAQEDAVRWILAKDPDYFSKEIPFIGYVQFLIEADVGTGLHRVKNVIIMGNTIIDDLAPTFPARGSYETPGSEQRWSFVAPP